MYAGLNNLLLYEHLGLDSIIECVKADAHNKQTLYLCEVCICRLSKSDMRNHIMGSLHRYNYIVSSTMEGVTMASVCLSWIEVC